MLSKGLTQTSGLVTTWRLRTRETVHQFCIGGRPMANRNMFQKSNRSYEIPLRNKSGAMTSTTKARSTIMTVSWPEMSNQSNLDSHFELGVGAPFHPTCFDRYTVHFARTTQTDTLYSVQELSNCPTQLCCLTTTLRLRRLYIWNMTWIWHQMMTDGKRSDLQHHPLNLHLSQYQT